MKLSGSVILLAASMSTLCSAFAPPKVPAFVTKSKSTAAAAAASQTALFAKGGSLAARLVGIGSATPKTIITNADLEKVVETSDEWIRTRTGISERHVLLQNEKLRDLSIDAAKHALDMAGIKPTDLDMIISCTSTSDDMFGDGTNIAHQLGCTTETAAYDLVAACSGFLFGTVTAGKFLSAPSTESKYILVVGADCLSRWIDWDDRNSCILFGDASGALVLKQDPGDDPTHGPGILGYAMHSNGGGYSDLNCGVNCEPRPVAVPQQIELGDGSYGKLHMNGKEVYKFATREVPTVILEALEAGGMTIDDVDWLLLHQANIRIMEVVATRLGMPFEKVITNLSKYGNTSAASIPLAMDEAVREGKIKSGDVVACAGFGAGLSWGACIFKWG